MNLDYKKFYILMCSLIAFFLFGYIGTLIGEHEFVRIFGDKPLVWFLIALIIAIIFGIIPFVAEGILFITFTIFNTSLVFINKIFIKRRINGNNNRDYK
jgi:hypothetical protein